MRQSKIVRLKIHRFNPEIDPAPHQEEYSVPYQEGMSVQNALEEIFRESDPTLAFRIYQCRKGICNSCILTINGKVRRACETLIKPDHEFLIEPPLNRRVIRDLVTQLGGEPNPPSHTAEEKKKNEMRKHKRRFILGSPSE